MADYRQFKEIKIRYTRINIPLLMLAILYAGAGVYLFANASSDRTFYYCDLVFTAGVIIAGLIGGFAALHRYKELPEGDFCCRPGKLTLVSPASALVLLVFGSDLLFAYFRTSDLSVGMMLFYGAFQTLVIILAMAMLLFSRVFGIVGKGDKFYILGLRGIKEHSYSEIAYTSTKTGSLRKVYDRNKNVMFRVFLLWPEADTFLSALKKYQVEHK